MATTDSERRIMLPQGVTIGAARETSATNAQGIVEQGVVIPVRLGNGSTTSIFVPYSEIHNTDAIEALIHARVSAIRAITG